MASLSALEAILLRQANVSHFITEKEIIDEIANLVSEIVTNDENDQNKDLVIVARHSEHPLEVGKSQFWVKLVYVKVCITCRKLMHILVKIVQN